MPKCRKPAWSFQSFQHNTGLRQTDRQTYDDSIYRASIASCGKQTATYVHERRDNNGAGAHERIMRHVVTVEFHLGHRLTARLMTYIHTYVHKYMHTRLTALFLALPGWASTRKVKPLWILPKQEKVSGSGISWAVCKSAHRSRQITMPAPQHSVCYRPDALPAAQPTSSMHWRHYQGQI